MTTDTFSRTTSFGLGTGYTWTSWDSDFAAAGDSTLLVDGSEVVIPSDRKFDSYIIDGNIGEIGTLSIDYFIPFDTGADFLTLIFRLAWGPGRQPFNFGFVPGPVISGTPYIYIATFTADNVVDQETAAQIAIVPANWYTFKAQYNAATADVSLKLFIRGSSEPDWQFSITTATTAGSAGSGVDSWLDFWFFPSTSGQFLDNFTYPDAGITNPSITADAYIFQPSFTADAYLFAPVFTADAWIMAPGVAKHYYDRDHTGLLPTTYVILDSDVGQFTAGTNLNEVIWWLLGAFPEWITYLSSPMGYPAESTRNRHSRLDDHHGLEILSTYLTSSDLGTVGAIGSYPAGTPVATVLAGLLSSYAVQNPAFTADAALKTTLTGEINAYARIGQFNSITADAVLWPAVWTFTANATFVTRQFSANGVVRRTSSKTFTADSLLTRGVRAFAVVKRTSTKTFSANAVIVL